MTDSKFLKTFLQIALFLVGFYLLALLTSQYFSFSTSNRFLRILGVWQENSLSSHFYLPFLSQEDFVTSKAYTNYPYFYLPVLYFYTYLISVLFDLEFSSAQNFISLIDIIVLGFFAFILLAKFIFSKESGGVKKLIVSFLCLSLLITIPIPWILRHYTSVENFHPWATFLIAFLSYLHIHDRTFSRQSFIALFLLSLFAPFYLPFVFIVYLFAQKRVNLSRQHLGTILGVSLTAAISFLFPKLLANCLGVQAYSNSPLAWRMGLDGDTHYFQNILQAIFSPFYASERRWHFAYYFAYPPLFLSLLYMQGNFPLIKKASLYWLLCVAPYFLISIFFPQWVSIHPYVFDLNIVLATVSAVVIVTVDSEFYKNLYGISGIIWLITVCGMLMTQLLDLSRF